MTERDFQLEELAALETCLEDDEFSPEEIEAILQRVKEGEDVNVVVLDYRPWYA